MSGITLEECKRSCIEIWQELSVTGDWMKPKWSYKYENGCPCCEYSWYWPNGADNCAHCPIWEDQGEYETCRCENDPETPYAKWLATTIEDGVEKRREYALEMVKLAEQIIDDEEEL